MASNETLSSQVLLHLTFNDSPTTYLHLLLPPTDSSIFNIRLVTIKTQKPLTTTDLYVVAHNLLHRLTSKLPSWFPGLRHTLMSPGPLPFVLGLWGEGNPWWWWCGPLQTLLKESNLMRIRRLKRTSTDIFFVDDCQLLCQLWKRYVWTSFCFPSIYGVHVFDYCNSIPVVFLSQFDSNSVFTVRWWRRNWLHSPVSITVIWRCIL